MRWDDAPAPARRLPSRHVTFDVLGLIARGRADAETAAELFLGEPTLETHVIRILAELQLRDRVHAVVLTYECGLVRPGAG
jgi:DNA-binding NarL/FixJ family response regulator